MQTRIEAEARQAIQQYIIKLHEHPATLQALVARAESLLPYIEEALHYIGVPEDLKYLAIQESRLNPYAVSRSAAVGYWQFKDYTAREVGLLINDTIDERRHLFRSSAGAALYLSKQYYRHRNWLFAIIAYYEGGTGALPYIDTAYVGKNEICIRATTHWYALRAIAHKLVFESLIKRRIYALKPIAYTGPSQPIWSIAQHHGLSPDSFLVLNPWLLRPVLPGGRPSTYYVPLQEAIEAKPQEPLKSLFTPPGPPSAIASISANYFYEPTSSSPPPPDTEKVLPSLSSPRTPPPQATRPKTVALLPLSKEPYLHHEWQYPPPAELDRRLQRRNPFYQKGNPILVASPSRAHIHIVQRGESARDIAKHYKRPLEQLLHYNTIENPDSSLPVGLRFHLREPRPYDERPILYQWP
ncbi:MAG: transglycosylase SLT domain-containing protein [Bacteroidia bacterium]|nr:transglycosylase SLT domain-containing protein [Bacteroidia bacterium]